MSELIIINLIEGKSIKNEKKVIDNYFVGTNLKVNINLFIYKDGWGEQN